MGTLPTRWNISSLPFSTSFEVSLFTLTYVLVQGGWPCARTGGCMRAAGACCGAVKPRGGCVHACVRACSLLLPQRRLRLLRRPTPAPRHERAQLGQLMCAAPV